jgi:hypothetical protein
MLDWLNAKHSFKVSALEMLPYFEIRNERGIEQDKSIRAPMFWRQTPENQCDKFSACATLPFCQRATFKFIAFAH